MQTKLPKILHLYWGRNQPLSYFRYLTVISFLKYNPDWKLFVWVPDEVSDTDIPWKTGEQVGEYIGHDYIDDLKRFVIEINMSCIGIPHDIPEVHKSDLLRWYMLGMYGGVWSDFDILYTAPLSSRITKDWNGPCLCYYELPLGNIKNHKFQAIGFLASVGRDGKDFFTEMYERGIAKIPQTEYQAFGATMLEKEQLPAWEASGRSVYYIDKNLVYPVHSHNDVQKYFSPVEVPRQQSIGLHWYAGHPVNGKQAATITEANICDKANDYSICKEALKISHILHINV